MSRKKKIKICHFCGEKIEGRGYGDNRFCSKTCMGRYSYYADLYKLDKTKRIYRYVSTCKNCGKEFEYYRNYRQKDTALRVKYCSDECRSSAPKGKPKKIDISLCSKQFINKILQEVLVNGEDAVIEMLDLGRQQMFDAPTTNRSSSLSYSNEV